MIRRKPHVAIFFGGEATTSDLSEESGFWVCQYMPREDYQVTPVRVTQDGQWQVPLGSLPRQGSIKRMLGKLFQTVPALPPTEALGRLLRRPVDAFMTLLRGKGGDDGALHGLGNTLEIPVIGSGLPVAQQTSHKYTCLTRTSDIVGSPYTEHYRAGEDPLSLAEDIRQAFVPPIYIKPATQEGSAGIHLVSSEDELAATLKRSLANGDVLVQQGGQGQEISITAYDTGKGIEVLPATLVVPRAAAYFDQMAKRRAGRVSLHTLNDDFGNVADEANQVVRDVYEELGCEGAVSFDLLASEDGLKLLEVNTIPTLTQFTPLLGQMKAGQMHPGRLLDRLIRSKLGS